MLKTEYTPGPWHLGKPDRNGEDAHMCEVMTAYTTKNEGAAVGCYDIICRTWSHERLAASVRLSRQECIANARLIAAAPELLEALKSLLPYFEGEHHPDHPHVREAKVAIAKAES